MCTEKEAKTTAVRIRRFETDGAAVSFHSAPDDREPKAASGLARLAGRRAAEKRLEDGGLFIAWNAGPPVLDDDFRSSTRSLDGYQDSATR